MTASPENNGASEAPLIPGMRGGENESPATGIDLNKGTSQESTAPRVVPPVTPAAAPIPEPAAKVDRSEPSLGALVAEASESISTILRGEIELAKLELRSSVKNVGVGVGFFVTAVVLLFFSLTFGFIALAEGIIALGLSRWLGYLIVFGAMLVVIGLLVFMGIKKVKRVKAPERTIATSKDTIAYLKANTGSSATRP